MIKDTDVIKVKICGLTRLCDIDAANRYRPDYIGFVFAEKSRRKVTPGQALELREKLDLGIAPVGVFVDETIENIIALTQSGTIDLIQLHGSENEEYIMRLKALTGNPVIKAVTIRKKGDAQKWDNTSADFLLLDNQDGGTGKSFDWDLIGEVTKPYFLAGGLCPENACDYVKYVKQVERKKPYALDVSSGVETNGLKDPEKIREFIRRVRDAE